MDIKSAVLASVAAHESACVAASDAIWEHPEVNFHEDFASETLIRLLRENGFAVETGLCGLPNAFRAQYGSGRPVIAYLGEFDALSTLSQKAGCAVREPVQSGAPGHGCGHNLLGVGALSAAIAIKELIEAGQLTGTVVYLGCPAEETASAKAFLARDGGFTGIDAMLTWHPWDYNGIWPGGSLANVKMIFRFHGHSAHAASSPHLGRSALDALELMNVGVQFLREHVPDDTRIHYAVTDAGGASPNVVQNRSEAVYLVRSPRLGDLADIRARVEDCARGAALMTGTTVDIEFVKGCSNLLTNTVLDEALLCSMREIGVPAYTQEDMALAAALHGALEAPETTLSRLSRRCDSRTREALLAYQGEPLYTFIAPYTPGDAPVIPVSTDVGDASWCAPVAQISTAAWAADTPAHSWQAVAMGKSAVAHKAMSFAASVIALTGARLMAEPELLARAQREFAERIAREPYRCPIPADVKPRL